LIENKLGLISSETRRYGRGTISSLFTWEGLMIARFRALNLIMAFMMATGLVFTASPPTVVQAAAISLSSPYSQDFNALATSGTSTPWTDDNTIAGWYAGRYGGSAGTGPITTYRASSGTDTTGAVYSFGTGTATERALGSLGSNSDGGHSYGVLLINDTGNVISALDITYTGEQWRNGGNAIQQALSFDYQVASNISSLSGGSWTTASSFDFIGPIASSTSSALDGNASANRVQISGLLTVDVPVDYMIMLRWNDPNDSGSDHGLAIDDVSITTAISDEAPTVISTNPDTDELNVVLDANIEITFSEAISVSNPWFDITCTSSGSHGAGEASVGNVFNLNPDTDFVSAETCTVTLDHEHISDQDADDPPDLMDEDYSWSFSTIGLDPAPTVKSTNPGSDATAVELDSDLEITFSEAVDVATGWYDISCGSSGIHTAVVSGGSTTFTLNPDSNFIFGELCTVTLENTLVTDQDTEDPYDEMVSDYTWSFTATLCGDAHTLISAVQGSGMASPLVGSLVTLEGIVVADMQGTTTGLNGFFIQSLPGEEDGDSSSSEGIMIYNNTMTASLGDVLRVQGTVTEYQNLTEIGSASLIATCSTGNIIPAPVVVDLPDTADGAFSLEPFEGMLVTIPEDLMVQQNYFQARFGQITLAAGGRIEQMNNLSLGGGSPYEYTRMIILDDANSSQNVNPMAYYGVDDFMRAGDTIVGGVTGIVDQGAINSTSSPYVFPFNYYRLQPTVLAGFTRENPRPVAPSDIGGTLKVVGFNTLNYFPTLDMAPYRSTYPYDGGSNTPRGADNATEFIRQQDKLVAAMAAMHADVYGLLEIESWDAAAAPQALVTALNTYLAAHSSTDTYAVVPDPSLGYFDVASEPDSDYIQVGLIYKTQTVSLVGASLSVNDTLFNRSPFAQVFMENATGEQFVVVANHFKSKGSCPSDGSLNEDQGDGQGCWNAKRVLQAEALLYFIDTTLVPLDPDVMVIGDLNAYGGEDPIQTLEAGGLINQIAAFVPEEDRYSFVFDGSAGYLDHFLSTSSLDSRLTGVDFFHINADETSFIDYNTEYKGGSYSPDLYLPHMYRSSDHDPVMVGLSFSDAPSITALELLGSLNGADYTSVFGNIDTGYVLPLDPTLEFQYLDAGVYTVNKTLADGYYGFYLDETSVPAGFYDYWDAKGVNSGASGWQAVMWQIINGNQPMYFLKVDGSDYSLVDGLTYLLGGGDAALRVSGDYPLGSYVFSGTVEDLFGVMGTEAVVITFEELPDITALELLVSLDTVDWDAAKGTIDGGYTYNINPKFEFQYLDAGVYTVNKTLADGYYGFYLDETSVPVGFNDYWDAKGVNAGATGWQAVMWQIINGNQPMFFLEVDGSDYSLVDGLTYLLGGDDAALRVSGDYPLGTYSFFGTVEGIHYGLGVEEVSITLERLNLYYMPVMAQW
jgi:predicted extracellular nuclease